MDFIAEIRSALVASADQQRAAGQQAYMKSTMPFYGVSMPEVRKITRQIAKSYDLDLAGLAQLSRQVWDGATHREERHVALNLHGLPLAKGKLELVDLYEYQAVTGAWWDYVDELAHRIANLHDAHPQQTARIVGIWSVAESFWLRRLAIISQLQRKERTNVCCLAEVIEANRTEKEFFIRKAIGWALRDYARFDPAWVRSFVASHELSPLSKREALKHL
ncbi:MAG: DNA alkylation repair protein [Propionibacteriaceae bacterium]|nr:DNA alkylation repair protein [Propionibacteriaceae bacterium]